MKKGKAATDQKRKMKKVFKDRLVIWLKDNDLKLPPKYLLDIPSSSNNNANDTLGIKDNIGIEPRGIKVLHETILLECKRVKALPQEEPK